LLVETNQQAAMEVAERLRLAIRSLKIPSGEQVTASFGVAECPTDAQTAAGIQKAADVALYDAKRAGRDRVVGASGKRSNSMAASDVQRDAQRDVQGDGNRGMASRG